MGVIEVDKGGGAPVEAASVATGALVSSHIVLERCDGADSLRHLVTGEVIKLPFNTGGASWVCGVLVSWKAPPPDSRSLAWGVLRPTCV